MSGTKMRAPMEVNPGESNVTLDGLIPGNTYTVRAVRAVQGQSAGFEIFPTEFTGISAVDVNSPAGKPNAIRFTATGTSVTFGLRAKTTEAVSGIPMFLSVFNETALDAEPARNDNPLTEMFSKLQVVPSVSPQSLISNVLIGGDCFTVTNITSTGNPLAMGTFSSGGTNIGIADGMVMSTGRISILPGPNNSEAANGGFNVAGFDPDLAGLVSNNDLYDISKIEFDFVPTANTVQFDFVFGSEEYCEYVGTDFNDAFGFFISGPGITGVKNIALVPGTGNVPVTTNNVNHLTHSNYYVNNSQNVFECLFSPTNNTYLAECQLDGWTKLFTATATVIPCQKYHIKLAIADTEDQFYDSAVFMRANSFNAGGQVIATPAYNSGQQSAIEGCVGGSITFERGNGDLSQALPVTYTVSPASTATEGVDYAPLPTNVVIPAGQTQVVVPITIFSDAVNEGQESIVLLLSNSCQCQQAQINFLISDNLPFLVSVQQDTSICEGFSANLSAIAEGGIEPYIYAWNTGDTTQAIVITPTQSSTYTVTVTDACGGTATDEAQVLVAPIARDTFNYTICAGDSIEINGQYYSADATVVDTSYSGYFICGHISTYNLKVLAPITGTGAVSFCNGESVVIGGEVYTGEGFAVDTLTSYLGCDSIVTYTLTVLPVFYDEVNLSFCPGESVVVNGVTYSSPGTVVDTLTSSIGCDSIVIYNLKHLPQPTKTENISFCPGESVTLGSTTYTNSATVTLTLPAATGCDTIATYHLQLLTQPTRSETIGLCPGETVVLGGTTYSAPATAVLTLPASTGCDTIVTYNIQSLVPAPSVVSIKCPTGVSVGIASGLSGAVATFDDPLVSSTCTCPGIDLVRTQGLASGSTFPLGVTQVCYRAQDACGQAQSCCFNVTVEEESACDIKTIGCMKYELLTITADQFKNKTYRIRVTNNCANKLIYTAIQLPDGITAMSPANGATYNAPSGNQYFVRNPNYSPFYSVRFRSMTDSISSGESDILKYTLPAQADVTYIHILSRLQVQQYYEAHLNTFYCPIGVTPPQDRDDESTVYPAVSQGALQVFPNPNDGSLFVDLAAWDGETVTLQVFNGQGQQMYMNSLTASYEPQAVELPQGIADGMYFMEVSTEAGEKEVVKIIVKH